MGPAFSEKLIFIMRNDKKNSSFMWINTILLNSLIVQKKSLKIWPDIQQLQDIRLRQFNQKIIRHPAIKNRSGTSLPNIGQVRLVRLWLEHQDHKPLSFSPMNQSPWGDWFIYYVIIETEGVKIMVKNDLCPPPCPKMYNFFSIFGIY